MLNEKIMRALEFKSKIRDNKISIPRRVQSELINGSDKSVRVVILMKDSEVYDEKEYRQMTKRQFLEGYAESDSIYDS